MPGNSRFADWDGTVGLTIPQAAQETLASQPPLLAGVCERDVDLLFLEELLALTGFAAWLTATAANYSGQTAVLAARHQLPSRRANLT